MILVEVVQAAQCLEAVTCSQHLGQILMQAMQFLSLLRMEQYCPQNAVYCHQEDHSFLSEKQFVHTFPEFHLILKVWYD